MSRLPITRGDRGAHVKDAYRLAYDALTQRGREAKPRSARRVKIRTMLIALKADRPHTTYGPALQYAVRRLQSDVGLRTTGTIDQRTLNALRRIAQRGSTRTPVTAKPPPRHVYPTQTHYSQNFTRTELDCKCGCTTPRTIAANLTVLAANLEHLRLAMGEPIPILSGYRCPTHNRAVGGASQSQHLTGRAFDAGRPSARLLRAMQQVPGFRDGGIGVYAHGGQHGDVRPNGPARWRG